MQLAVQLRSALIIRNALASRARCRRLRKGPRLAKEISAFERVRCGTKLEPATNRFSAEGQKTRCADYRPRGSGDKVAGVEFIDEHGGGLGLNASRRSPPSDRWRAAGRVFGRPLHLFLRAKKTKDRIPNIRAEGFRDSKKTLVLKKVALIRRFWRFTWRV